MTTRAGGFSGNQRRHTLSMASNSDGCPMYTVALTARSSEVPAASAMAACFSRM